MKVFVSDYHISVNHGLVQDLVDAGLEVVMPSLQFGAEHIKFFAANEDHVAQGARMVDYQEFLALEPMAIIINCSQMYEDMMTLYRARGEKDKIVHLTSQMGIGEWFPTEADYLMTHELVWHRKSQAKHKILYFSRPLVIVPTKSQEDIKNSYNDRQIRLYINHFETKIFDNTTFDRERACAEEFRAKWLEKTGWRIPFFGFENKDGYLTQLETQENIRKSMFTLVFKGHETWGQMVNESMLIGTPGIFLEQFIVDMFTDYLITQDTAIVGKTVDELLAKIDKLRLEDYETLVTEARSQSEMYCNDAVRVDKVRWLFGKVAQDLGL